MSCRNERQTIPKNALELGVSDLGIQKIDTCGVYLEQDVFFGELRIWDAASPPRAGSAVTIEDECLHRCDLPHFTGDWRRTTSRQAAAGTPATCRSSPFGSAKNAGPVP